MINLIKSYVKNIPLDIRLFIVVIVFSSFSQGIYDSTFNNFLKDNFSLDGLSRTALELPREFPGFSVAFVSALLFFLSSTRLASFAMFIQGIGIVLLAFFGSAYTPMLAWLFIFSLGQHIFLPLFQSIGMELSRGGQEGKRLGQLNSVRNLAVILGSGIVFIGFNYIHFSFTTTYVLAGCFYFAAGVIMLFMKNKKPHTAKARLTLYKEYRLFYWLTILYGTRKQLFITFAPWVLVAIFEMPTQFIATLLFVGGIIGILFQPILGKAVDRLGEKKILALEAIILVPVCVGYGFSLFVFPRGVALAITSACFIADGLLLSFGMARATYLKKIAIDQSHVAPTLALGTTIDHVFSISIALVSGVVWVALGYQIVFLMGACIATINLVSVLFVKVPAKVAQNVTT
jgi:predicted MFS family arabinose efflux permease